MTKHEIMKNYTTEQLVDMVVKYQEMTRQIILNKNVSNTDMFKNKSAVAYEAELSEHKAKINHLKSELDRKENTINQIDNILNELFGVTHDIAKPGEFKEILKKKICGSEFISRVIPTTPIGIAKMLSEECLFEIRELRQIAKHLLVYCNSNMEGEE